MKERPILFSGEMVRAILDGRKTQTRRVVKWPLYGKPEGHKRRVFGAGDAEEVQRIIADPLSVRPAWRNPCPHGRPGDRLWVRETWAMTWADGVGEYYIYREQHSDWPKDLLHYGRWRPSIHMPRAASRILLEITEVRVERLRGITEADARAEGCPAAEADASAWFADLWQRINGPGAWDATPWVWAITFRRLENAR